MGEAYGELELNELMPIKDYLDSPPSIDEFLYGVAKGKEKAIRRKAQKPPKGGKGVNLEDVAKLTENMTKGS